MGFVPEGRGEYSPSVARFVALFIGSEGTILDLR